MNMKPVTSLSHLDLDDLPDNIISKPLDWHEEDLPGPEDVILLSHNRKETYNVECETNQTLS